VERLFGHVGESGFGRDASLGRGRFSVRVEGASALDGGRGRRRLSLSHGTITPNMGSPRYRLFTHYGKVGPEMNAEIGRPWKRPLLLTRPGLTFDALDEGPFGAWLDGVHQDRPEIGHNAFHVVLAFEEAEP
jgi:CRISPR-associated protein Csm4